MIAKTDTGAKAAIQAGAANKLVGLLQKETEPAVTRATLGAIDGLSRLDEGREAFVRAGGVCVLCGGSKSTNQIRKFLRRGGITSYKHGGHNGNPRGGGQ